MKPDLKKQERSWGKAAREVFSRGLRSLRNNKNSILKWGCSTLPTALAVYKDLPLGLVIPIVLSSAVVNWAWGGRDASFIKKFVRPALFGMGSLVVSATVSQVSVYYMADQDIKRTIANVLKTPSIPYGEPITATNGKESYNMIVHRLSLPRYVKGKAHPVVQDVHYVTVRYPLRNLLPLKRPMFDTTNYMFPVNPASPPSAAEKIKALTP